MALKQSETKIKLLTIRIDEKTLNTYKEIMKNNKDFTMSSYLLSCINEKISSYERIYGKVK